MLELKNEHYLARLLGYGSAFVAIFLLINQVSDPVNVTKLVALSTIAFAASFIVFFKFGAKLVSQSRTAVVASLVFVIFSIWSVINSESPFVLNFYGTYGRNTGFLTYFLLTLVFLSALVLRSKKSFEILVLGLFMAGLFNVLYGLWTMAFGDFVGWNNPYGNILGTFGNPNFIGSFLGIFVSMLLSYVISEDISWKMRFVGVVVILVALVEIKSSSAVQGIVVSAGGFALVVFFRLRSVSKNWLMPAIYSGFVGIVGFIALLGALQKGPLSSIVYKTSVSLRGEYWNAGINMAMAHPFTGVGMDSYGDWFRRMRRPSAMILPGPETVTNAAHNVPLDLMAYGGWPLFISYLFILFLSALAIVRKLIRTKNYDKTFVALSIGWVCYQVQSIISINQIGLAVWGWLFSGAVIAYEFADRNNLLQSLPVKTKSKNSNIFSVQLVGSLAAILGLLIALPPLNSDMSWRKALAAGNVEMVKKVLTPSYLHPESTYLYASAVSIFESNNLNSLAHEFALKSVNFNPSSFEVWRQLYSIKASTPQERELAKRNMIRLDPLNEEWKKLP